MTDATATERQRRRRRRQRDGLVQITIELPEVALEEELIAMGELDPIKASDRAELARGLERVLRRVLSGVTP